LTNVAEAVVRSQTTIGRQTGVVELIRAESGNALF
jgi:hypothetical protein